MNFDQIVRELKKLDLDVKKTRKGGSKYIDIEFKRDNSIIICNLSLEFELNLSTNHRIHSTIREEIKDQNFTLTIEPNNQTEFFNIVKELKTTDTSFKQIRNKKQIVETEKDIKKLEIQLKDTRFRLGERKLWLKTLEGKINSTERKKAMSELVIKIKNEF